MKRITILGSTGSIGTSTLDVVRQNADRFAVFALAVGNNTELLLSQILEFRPRVVVTATESGISDLADRLVASLVPAEEWPEMLHGGAGLVAISVAPETDVVLSAIVGVAGLEATHAAARAGKRIGLANKEVLVSAGALMMAAVERSGAELIPVDSEHNGAHQCLRSGERRDVTRLILTASGGPFRLTPAGDLASVTPSQALRHPTWKMGNRITIDSATMMNKGFEVIEACWLFGLDPSEVDVVVHPQSSVHAMIEYRDGSVIAQVSATDMRMPIQYALTYPDRWAAPVPRLDWSQSRQWEFHAPDLEKFPLLRLAYEAQRAGGSAACTLNAADEVAVAAFLDGKISFPAIAEIVEETLTRVPVRRAESIGEVLEIDRQSREVCEEVLATRAAA
ncbi:MAG: 1-deoxy-D-xylulose-5-phosphate reductoisomerase [Bryobacterales bacterium]|nr:1-deoxy-D-xylulose-5-phosphate reductoisomerase [Bryobacterales bacterium]